MIFPYFTIFMKARPLSLSANCFFWISNEKIAIIEAQKSQILIFPISQGGKFQFQFKKVFIVNPHIKRHITEKHYNIIVTMLIVLMKDGG